MGAELCSAFKAFQKLTLLDLRDNGLKVRAATHLACVIPDNCRLRVVKFPILGLQEEGRAADRWDAAVAGRSAELDLTGNDIGDAGARDLAGAVKDLKGLKWLYLSYNSIGDAGARDLAGALKDLKGLKALGLRYNDIGAECKAELRSQFSFIPRLMT